MSVSSEAVALAAAALAAAEASMPHRPPPLPACPQTQQLQEDRRMLELLSEMHR